MNDSTIRVVIADDHEVVRKGYADLLGTQPDFTVVGTARDGAEAVRLCQKHSVDVVLMDVRMPTMNGIEATGRLAGGPRILILTTFDLDEYVYEALRAGASGFLLKDISGEELIEAVRLIARGQALLTPTATRLLISEFARQRHEPNRAVTEALDTLTSRENEVLKLVAEGLSNPEIANRLFVAEETVKTHVSRLLSKLGLRGRTQAVVLAYESGLVVPQCRAEPP